MPPERRYPTFESLEAAQEYVTLLAESALEARREVAEQQCLARAQGAARTEQACQLATLKLAQLGIHLDTSRRLLSDLRKLRRLLLHEREPAPAPVASTSAGEEPD